MPINGFSIGKDLILTVVTSAGPLNLSLITNFKSKQDTTEEKIKGLDGITRHVRFFEGWSGNFDIQRQDHAADDYFSQLEADYYAGVQETEVTITETITEVDGSVTQYRYREVLLKMDDAGEWKGDAAVKQMLSFIASRRVKIA